MCVAMFTCLYVCGIVGIPRYGGCYGELLCTGGEWGAAEKYYLGTGI